MLTDKEKLFTLDDVTIIPNPLTHIEHRETINCFYNYNNKKYLPIFTAPMSNVVNEENLHCWHENNIIPIIPRNISLVKRLNYALDGEWIALGLTEFDMYFSTGGMTMFMSTKKEKLNNITLRVLIDIANGHMEKIQELVKSAREIEKTAPYTLEIMIGNIGNPKIFDYIDLSLIDYVRLSIGTGSCCLTTPYTGVHYPMGSLIADCRKKLDSILTDKKPKLIADGGMKTFADIIKALALGADYVMLGSLLASVLESASPCYIWDKGIYYTLEQKGYKVDKYNNKISGFNFFEEEEEQYDNENEDYDFELSLNGFFYDVYKRNYGMSTPEAQKEINPAAIKLKHTEGKETYMLCIYTLKEWCKEMIDCMRSTMSYADIDDVQYIQEAECRLMTDKAKQRINEL